MANNEFLEILSEGVLEELKQVEALVKSIANDIKSINSFKASNTPSGADGNIQKVNNSYNQRTVIFKDLATQIDNIAKNQNNLTASNKSAVIAEDNLTKAIKKRFDIAEKEANSANAKKALQDREVALKKLNELTKEATALEEKRQNVLNKGYGSDKELNKIAKKFEDLNLRIKEASSSLLKLDKEIHKVGDSSAVPKLQIVANRQNVDEKVAQQNEKERISAEKLLNANKKLNDAYGQLTQRRNETARALQNSILETGKYSAETRKLQKEFDGLNKKVGQADKAIGKFSQSNNGLKALTSSISSLMGAFGIGTGLYLAVDIGKSIYNTTKELQSLDLALKMVSGSSQEFASNKGFISEISDKWGLDIKKVSDQFVKFYADAKGKLSGEEIEQTFEGIGKAGSVMGLSLEKQQSAFTAFQQMLSKGTIQAQELKLQLGDALPGSIKVATAAYQKLHPELKVTEALLYKHMEQGKVISAEMIPEMVKGYQKLYGIENIESINTMASAQNRVKNAWTEWVRELSSGNEATSKTVSLMNFLANNLKTIINVFVKGGTILGVYLGVTKALNFAIRQSVLITEAYAIAKSVLTKRTAENTVAENINTVSKVGQTGATVALTGATEGATVATNVFNAALLKNPIVAVIALVMAGVTAYLLLRDSTDDATASLIKYEQAKRNAEKSATKTVKGISKKEDNLRGQLELEQKELLKLQDIQKTATKNDLKDVADRVKAKKEEIGIIKERLRLEGIVVGKTKTQVSQNAYKSANKAEAERNALELKKLKKEEELQKVRDTPGNTSQLAKGKLTKERDLLKSISELEKQIRSKNVEIIKNNKIFNDLRVKNTKDTNAEEIKNSEWYDKKIEELDGKRLKSTKRTESVKYLIEIERLKKEKAYVLGEDPKINKAQIKTEKDLAKEREQILKEQYEAELSNLERQKELISDLKDKEENSLVERLSAEKLYAFKQIQIAMFVHDEKVRIADKEIKERKLTSVEGENLKTPINNELQTSIENAKSESLARMNKLTEENLKKEDEKTKEWYKNNPPFFVENEDSKKAREETVKLNQKALEDVKNYIASFQIELGQNLGFDETFNFFLKMDEDGRTMFEKLNDGALSMEEKQKATFIAIAEAAQEMFNFISNASQQNFDAEYARLEKQKKVALEFAGESDEAKKKIEEDYEKRKKAIAIREFKAKQKLAIVNIAIDTAQAVMAVSAKARWWEVPLMIALGAVQAGIVASQKVPEFWQGGIHEGGMLKMNDDPYGIKGGNFREVALTPDGNIFKPQGKDVYTDLPKGTEIFKDYKAFDQFMFNKDLNNIMMDNGIGNAPKIVVNNTGMTEQQMESVMMRTLGSMAVESTIIDANGFKQVISKGHSRTIEHTARITGRGLKIGR